MISPNPPREVARPLMLQDWEQLTFIHWHCEPQMVQRLLPEGLQVDTYDGKAWVGLVPFVVRRLRPPHLPWLPWLSNFPETNVRTYVVGPDGERGIWFFSLDAARLAAVVGAKAAYRLPYEWARMRVRQQETSVQYWSRRRRDKSLVDVSVDIGEKIPADELTDLDHFLTARFCLYARWGDRIAAAQVEHHPWPLHRATLLRLEQTATDVAGLILPEQLPLVHYSPGVRARIEAPKILK